MHPKVVRGFQQLPQATGRWHCRWFITLCFTCAVLFTAGLFTIPGVWGVVAMVAAVGFFGYGVGKRSSGEGVYCR